MDFRKGEIIAIDKPYRMSSFGALAHVRYLLSKKLGFKGVLHANVERQKRSL